MFKVLNYAKMNTGYAVNLTRRLIQVKSINPPGNESEAAYIVGDELSKLGFKVDYIEASPGRTNVVASLEGENHGKSLIFNGHIDVVPPGNLDAWNVDPFEGIVSGGKIYGRGACDMKSAIAAIIAAAKSIIDSGVKFKGKFIIHAVADEETGGKYGTGFLVSNGFGLADSAIICEPSVWGGVIGLRPAVRGACWLQLETIGRAAHASNPSEGVNAVLDMAEILLSLEKFKFKCTPHKWLPEPTISPGTVIYGGVKTNVIPDRCVADVDVRVVPGLSEHDVLAQLEDFLEDLKKKRPSINVKIKVLNYVPPAEISEDAEILKCALNAAKMIAGNVILRGGYGSNDSHFYHSIGVPTICGFGPGDHLTGNAHGPNENVSIDVLSAFIGIYAATFLLFTSSNNIQ
ncbi:MAG: M20 family metallopeptidase [Candidatus Methanomethylicia archaeon]